MKSSVIPGVLFLIILGADICDAHFFRQPGTFIYASNTPIYKGFDTTADGKFAVALKDDLPNSQAGLLTSFDPTSGTVFDTANFGFGPLDVALAETSNGIRVVVLMSEGGPRKIYLYSLDSAGKFTLITSTQLTTSNIDLGSNLVLSAGSQTGFVIVSQTTAFYADLVTFSLNDGSILNRLQVSNGQAQLFQETYVSMVERSNKRMLTFLKNVLSPSLEVIDAINPSQPVDKGAITLPNGGTYSSGGNAAVAFSADGRYAFMSGSYVEFVAVDLSVMQTVSSMSGTYVCGNMHIYENAQQRLLATQCRDTPAILLIDATNPSLPQVINVLNLNSTETMEGGDVAFSTTGTRLFVQTGQRLFASTLPGLTTAWSETVPGAGGSYYAPPHHVMTYGARERVIAAWGDDALFGSFEGDMKRRGQLTSD
jgi:hypothetical protein